ncbi:MAG: hypothetical protein P8I61_01015 [Opitutae bacterium]|nr:hypothetical protein [Opitutae bacterium]
MNKILKLLAAFIAVTGIAFADTMLTESVSVSGFVDMSYLDADNEVESTSGIDQVEVDFTFNNGGPVTGQLDIEYEDADGNLNVEEAYITYTLTDGGMVTVGRFETMLLQDASEPTGLYQYSNAYDFYGNNFNAALYDNSDQGIKYSQGGWAISLVDNGDDKIGDGNATSTATDGNGDYSYEVSYSGKLSDKVTGFIGGRFTEDDANNNDGDILNIHLTYEEGPWVLGGEFVTGDNSNGGNILFSGELLQNISNAPLNTSLSEADIDLFSLFANYSYSDKASVTLRYSDINGDTVGITANNALANYKVDAEKITLAHNSALSDDLALILEYSSEESKYAADQDSLAVELLYAF